MHSGRLNRMSGERRRRLVDVAAAEFASAGYREASLNRIIAKCGMSKSSFYYVIESKDELFEFVMAELLGGLANAVEIPEPEKFRGPDYWPRVEAFFAHLVTVSQREESALTLGRMFYSDAPGGDASAGMLAAVRQWVEEVLRVGRSCGAVRADLPEALQCSVVLRILQVFDEWTVAHFDEVGPENLDGLAAAQFATVRRVLESSAC
ncbi:TetR/AcrR family transcriptional regulator [Mycolicibacterium wolinskyi]|uniref:TetR/AcrR family transcriptional regulator n=1 Tax=Mycolicibacterium wolinskyi TaxID=59750 RepID=UPI003917AC61